MVYQIIYIVESLIVLGCMHCTYGEKIRFNRKFISVCLLLLLITNAANYDSMKMECSLILYIIMELYCICTFKCGFRTNVINYLLSITVATIIEFISWMFMTIFIRDNITLKALCAESMALIMCYLMHRYFGINKIATWAARKNLVFGAALLYTGTFICVLIIQFKVFGGIKTENFIWGIPFTIFILLMSKQLAKYQSCYEEKEKELEVYVKDKESYKHLITKIRMRQHEMNNHITAILAMHYTKPTYKELVMAQKEYCQHIITENKYNVLLTLDDSILVGFLYDKFNAIEKMGMVVECHISVKGYHSAVPEYYLIEMLGILLDNAVEALTGSDLLQVIQLEICENEGAYKYFVRNPYYYVNCDEMDSWFEFEKSSKGTGRGMGLFHLRCLCREWNCYVGCNNVDINDENWIEFIIETDRKV